MKVNYTLNSVNCTLCSASSKGRNVLRLEPRDAVTLKSHTSFKQRAVSLRLICIINKLAY